MIDSNILCGRCRYAKKNFLVPEQESFFFINGATPTMKKKKKKKVGNHGVLSDTFRKYVSGEYCLRCRLKNKSSRREFLMLPHFLNIFNIVNNFWNNYRGSVFAGQRYKISGHFSLDFGENMLAKLCFYLN